MTKLSSKGQIVIPAELRKGIKEGEKLMIMQNKNVLIIKKVSALDKNFAEDMEFARRTEEAWKRLEKGKFISMPMDKFLEELSKC